MPGDRVIVIGAGIGGLACALALASRGLDVTVVEKALSAGGKLREVTIGGQGIDSGPTVFTMRRVFDALFEAAGTSLEAELGLTKAEILARHAWEGGARLDLFADQALSADAIGAFAGPAEAARFNAFCAEAATIYRTLKETFLDAPRPGPFTLARRIGLHRPAALFAIRPFETLWRALGKHFQDPRLRQLFGRYATYSGSSPFAAPATLMLIAHVEQDGVWLVDGGMQRLADALRRVATARGVAFRFGETVRELSIANGRAAGVVLASGERLAADFVVSNADTAAFAAGCFGKEAARAAPGVAESARSQSALTWSLVAKTNGFPLLRHNVFFSPAYGPEFDDVFTRGCLPAAPTVYLCAQDRAAADGPPPAGPERLFALVNAPARSDTAPLTPEEIAACATRSFERMRQCGLTVERVEANTVTTTPTDFAALFPATGGALYGRASHGWTASFRRPGSASAIPGLYLAGGSAHPGAGVPMAALSGKLAAQRLLADRASMRPVPPGGYLWWYLDAVSDDGRHALTLIAFVGSVFSPYYAWSGRRDPENHCAINIALYGPSARWAMTERGRAAVTRDAENFHVGPSALAWQADGSLLITLDEIGAPIPRRIRGTIRVTPSVQPQTAFSLDAAARHLWQPIAPVARIDVALDRPDLAWQGDAYLDSNRGDEPLESGFQRWTWSRAHVADGCVVLYDSLARDGTASTMALGCSHDGRVTALSPPPERVLPTTAWRIARASRADAGAACSVEKNLEDTPFYARSLLRTQLYGEPAQAFHESLSLDRFRSPVVRAMLPFRMPRRWGGG